METRKLLFYVPHLEVGGPQRVISELAIGLNKADLSVCVLANRAGGHFWNALETNGVSVASLDSSKRFPKSELRKYLDNQSFDGLMATQDGVVTAALAKKGASQFPYLIARPANHISSAHVELFRKNPFKHSISWMLAIWSLWKADHLVAQSTDIQQDLIRYRVPSNRISVINNPIALRNVQESETKSQSKVRLVSVGRLSRQKGYDLLIQAMARLNKDMQQRFSLKIYGRGPDQDKLQALIDSSQLGASVSLCGHLDNPRDHLTKFDYYISSSRYEGFPNSVLEALAEGVPVIAANCPGGLSDLVKPGLTGILCDAYSSESLADALVQSLESEFQMDDIREFVKKKFSTEFIVGEYKSLFLSQVQSTVCG